VTTGTAPAGIVRIMNSAAARPFSAPSATANASIASRSRRLAEQAGGRSQTGAAPDGHGQTDGAQPGPQQAPSRITPTPCRASVSSPWPRPPPRHGGHDQVFHRIPEQAEERDVVAEQG